VYRVEWAGRAGEKGGEQMDEKCFYREVNTKMISRRTDYCRMPAG